MPYRNGTVVDLVPILTVVFLLGDVAAGAFLLVVDLSTFTSGDNAIRFGIVLGVLNMGLLASQSCCFDFGQRSDRRRSWRNTEWPRPLHRVRANQ